MKPAGPPWLRFEMRRDHREGSPPVEASSLATGAALYLGAMVAMALMDACAKALIAQYHASQLLVFRGLFGMLPVAALLFVTGRPFTLPRQAYGLHAARLLAIAMATAFFFESLRGLHLAHACAIMLLAPALMALGGAILFKERLGTMLALALVFGAAGATLILSPWSLPLPAVTSALAASAPDQASPMAGPVLAQASPPVVLLPGVAIPPDWPVGPDPQHGAAKADLIGATVWAALAAVLYALAMILTKALSNRSEEGAMLWLTPFGIAALGVLPAAPQWSGQWSSDIGLLAGVGIFGGLSTLLIVLAMGRSPVSRVAPLEYSVFVFAAFLGWCVFGEAAPATIWSGVALMVVSVVLVSRSKPQASA